MARGFGTAKAHVFKSTLSPAGFIKGEHLYVRNTAGQIHGIHFQPDRFAQKYFINVGFHYDFLPPLLSISNGVPKFPVDSFHVIDFMIYTRLEHLMPPSYPRDWEKTPARGIDEQLADNALDAIGALDSLCRKWEDPRTFLELLPPSLLLEEERVSKERESLSDEEYNAAPPSPYEKALGGAWLPPRHFKLGTYLALIALRLDQIDLAEEYLEIAKAHVGNGNQTAFIKKLGKSIQRQRAIENDRR